MEEKMKKGMDNEATASHDMALVRFMEHWDHRCSYGIYCRRFSRPGLAFIRNGSDVGGVRCDEKAASPFGS